MVEGIHIHAQMKEIHTQTYKGGRRAGELHLTTLHVHHTAVVGSNGEGIHSCQFHRVVVVLRVELPSVIIIDEFLAVACEEIVFRLPGSICQVVALPFDEEFGDVLFHLPYTSLWS